MFPGYCRVSLKSEIRGNQDPIRITHVLIKDVEEAQGAV